MNHSRNRIFNLIQFTEHDALQYGEEAAAVLYVIRLIMEMHKHWQPDDWVDFDGVKHLQISDSYWEGSLPYKPISRIKCILKRLKKLNVISIKEGNYYVTLD